MNIKQIIINHFNGVDREGNQQPPRTPRIGRYNASSLYYIMKGWNKPEDYFSQGAIDEEGVRRMHYGNCMEWGLSSIFDGQGYNGFWGARQRKYLLDITEMTKEDGWKYKVYDISDKVKEPEGMEDRVTIVCLPDFCFLDTYKVQEPSSGGETTYKEYISNVIETKAPETPKYFEDIPDKYLPQLETQYRAIKGVQGVEPNVFLGVFHSPIDVFTYKFTPSDIKWRNMCTKVIAYDKAIRKINK